MANPKIEESRSVPLTEVKTILATAEKRDTELNYRSNKAKEFLDNFVTLSKSKSAELNKKLQGLNLTRLKEEHIAKIVDFLPKDANDLKIVLQAYPLSLPKKDQDAIVSAIKEFV